MAVVSEAPTRAGTTWQLVRAAWAVTAVFALSNSPTPLYVYWQHEFGYSAGTLTVVFAAYIAGLALTLLVAGRAADRYGRKRVVVPGIGVALVSAMLFVTADGVAALIVARLLVGVAVGIVVSAGMAAVVDLGGEHRRQLTSMLASIAMVFGAGLGPLLGGVAYQATPRPVGWVFSVNIVLLVVALLGYAGLPLDRPTGRRSPGFPWPRVPHVPAPNRVHLFRGAAVFAPGLTATSFVLSLGPSLLVLAVGNTSPLLAGGAACVMFLAATGSQLVLGRLEVRRLFGLGAASTVLAMVAVLATLATRSPVLFVAAALLAGSGQGLGQLGGLRLIAQHVETDRRAEANAALNISAYLPAAILTVATGYAVGRWGMQPASATLASVLGAVGLLLGLAAARATATRASR
ncbi:putative multi-drug efflux transporter [Actinocatenispora thailandica]|uniref:Putative multi-drug efflux transporter n=1 Tax=Actinocatenispora thailandica TaxID=227318 RepID=A0A7R7DUX6_9ACTN|nr:MFS transporter [Actinocatenispora thailandica]BCJ38339.1 putative multi-drug efflux transporter [Actinocatenispora thailandica]